MPNSKKVAVIGLDCAAPELVFERFRDRLPILRSLCEHGVWGPLESVVPPITVPAWSCMMSGKDPGELGIYGFRNRKDYSYDGLYLANSTAVKEDRLWDILSGAGKQMIVVAVPGTFPPQPVHGCMVSCFLTPSPQARYTYPRELQSELESRFGPYQLDVQNFRSEKKEQILQQIYRMTEQHFAMARHLITTRPWDFFMMVEIGMDRIHHGLWSFFDPSHRKYEKGNPYENAIENYYRFVDGQIGELIPLLGDETTVLVVSDHGAKRMEGGVCINEWLIREGYLRLLEQPPSGTPMSKVRIDWSKTSAWGEGGYYSRIFINVEGREPAGIVPLARYEFVRDELKQKLQEMHNDRGQLMGTVVHKPQDIYRAVRGIAPDLVALFGNLSWRSVGSVGTGAILTFENDTGPDDANHSQHGIFILKRPGLPTASRLEGLHLLDVAPTILSEFGLSVPGDMRGKIIHARE
jgi:predicted AlkP superfamily phosphohydrolase/phosphomutase